MPKLTCYSTTIRLISAPMHFKLRQMPTGMETLSFPTISRYSWSKSLL